jgi:hypothetical protein
LLNLNLTNPKIDSHCARPVCWENTCLRVAPPVRMNEKLVNVEMKGKVEVYLSQTMRLTIIRPHTSCPGKPILVTFQ